MRDTSLTTYSISLSCAQDFEEKFTVTGEQVKYQREAMAYLGQIVAYMETFFALFPEDRVASARNAANNAKYEIRVD
jgi:hypothetical protein